MALRYSAAHVPANGELIVQRDTKGRLWAWRVADVECLGRIEEVREGLSPGRKVFRTPDGMLFSDAKDAAAHLAKETK